MSLTISRQSDPVTAGKVVAIGDRKLVMGTISFDSSYPTGGEAIAPADLGFETQIDSVVFGVPSIARLVGWDQANKKAKVYTALGTEAGNGTDQSTLVGVQFIAIGK